jgi:hypothetical protein
MEELWKETGPGGAGSGGPGGWKDKGRAKEEEEEEEEEPDPCRCTPWVVQSLPPPLRNPGATPSTTSEPSTAQSLLHVAHATPP